MSEVPGRYWQDQRRKQSPFPSHPHLELRDGLDVYLVLPHSFDTHEARRFQVFGDGWHQDYIGGIGLDRLLDALKHGHRVSGSVGNEIDAIRDFYMDWQHVWSMDQAPQLIDRLKRDVENRSVAVFCFRRSPHQGIIRRDPGRPIPPAAGAVSGWSGRQKIVAMFKAIPDCLVGAAKGEFEAFLTPENLTIMAVFLGGIGALQAVPGADAAVDMMIASLAWWQFGWAGVIAGKDFIEAVIKADRATTRDEILLAAKLAAAALVSLGITVLLKKITENVHEVRLAKDEPQEEPPSNPVQKDKIRTERSPIKSPKLRSDLSNEWFDPKTGKLSWPPNDGFSSDQVGQTLDPGTQIDRYGSNFGRFLSPKGASFGARALPYDEASMPYHAFEVLKPLTVQSGRAAAWFDEEGGATQYMTSSSVDELIKNGFLRGCLGMMME